MPRSLTTTEEQTVRRLIYTKADVLGIRRPLDANVSEVAPRLP